MAIVRRLMGPSLAGLESRINVRVQPGARSDEIVGWAADARGDETLKIRLRAAAVEGKANAALIGFLAAKLGLKPRQVWLERGGQSRVKVVRIEGLAPAEIKARVGR